MELRDANGVETGEQEINFSSALSHSLGHSSPPGDDSLGGTVVRWAVPHADTFLGFISPPPEKPEAREDRKKLWQTPQVVLNPDISHRMTTC